MIAPGLLIFLTFVISPIVQSIWLSLHDWDGIGDRRFVGFGNYRELLGDYLFVIALKNNLIWIAFFTLAPVIGLLLAIFLHQKVGGIRAAKALFFMPFVISNVVVALVFAWFYDPNFGLLQKLTSAFGGRFPAILSNENLATFGVVAAGLWAQIAFCMVLFMAGLTGVDDEIVGAGRLDGAKGLSMLWHVILPQLIPAAFIAGIISMIGALRSFDLIALMTDGGPYGSSTVLAFYMYSQALFSYRFGYGAAIATVLFLIMSVFIAMFLIRLVRAERRGGM
jgi:multiple sugar transport system permease protein